MNEKKSKYALISVYDKTGVVELAADLETAGYTIIATGNTFQKLKDAGISNLKKISDITNFPEIMDGRVKTLHPAIFGGILSIRNNEGHLEDMAKNGISPIDFVVVNLYPFEEMLKKNLSFDEMLEYIDIGGVSLIRAAAKNFKDVCVVINPSYYSVITEIIRNKGDVPDNIKKVLAFEAFKETSRYDSEISKFLANNEESGVDREGGELSNAFTESINLGMNKVIGLRYGENPHQGAAFYKAGDSDYSSFRKLSGRDISYNNLLDIDSTLGILKDFYPVESGKNKDADAGMFSVVVKHTNPCGAALSDLSLKDAFLKARKTDEVSSYGGIIGFNRTLDADTARELKPLFVEIIVAPGYDKDALDILSSKKNTIIIEYSNEFMAKKGGLEFRSAAQGILVQVKDDIEDDVNSFKVVTNKKPEENIFRDLLFAWKIAKHVKSNAIVYAQNGVTLGIGAGQMSRIDSARFAREKMISAYGKKTGFVMASDGFFPFKDSVEYAGEIGVSAIIEPGGSIRDDEVINEANNLGMPLVFTNKRHFKH